MDNLYLKLAKKVVLGTDRLILRPVNLDDAEAMFAYASDVENTRYVFPTNKRLEETRNNIASIFLANPLGKWGIEMKSTRKFIGTIDFHKMDIQMKTAHIGYCLDKAYWNQGYATEALKSLIHLAFDELGMNKLMAVHDKDNPASGRVMEKAGMHFSHEEPYARMDPKEEGRVINWLHYRITKEDYIKQ